MNNYNKLYKELVEIVDELKEYYDIDKIKSYSVYVWNKEKEGIQDRNLFDINSDNITYYEHHEIIKEAIPIIKRIQNKLKEIEYIKKVVE